MHVHVTRTISNVSAFTSFDIIANSLVLQPE